MPLDRSQKLSWFVALPVTVAAVALIVVLRTGPAATPSPAAAPRPPEIHDAVARNLRAIYRGVRFHLLEHDELPQPSSAPTPPLDSCCRHPDRTCPPSPSQWELEPWPSIGFEVVDADPSSYSYVVDSAGSTFTIRAVGDPDCDGTATIRRIEATVAPGGTLDPDPVILP